ncbi:hypothetical protein NPIL_56441 [Nephila pilipes]|uniref:Uncharacterized protein n=1 Tax=Nephila pilipes TaxID=299642 RepID=A0A8X6NX20_NEPPI|nr:hypothetical protein NPIL_56441 [Nephila pilipes]
MTKIRKKKANRFHKGDHKPGGGQTLRGINYDEEEINHPSSQREVLGFSIGAPGPASILSTARYGSFESEEVTLTKQIGKTSCNSRT